MLNHIPKSRRFTLVELLTVMTVIAILLTMLLPAVGRARKMTYRTMCMNSMRNLCDFNTMYANEYGYFMAHANHVDGNYNRSGVCIRGTNAYNRTTFGAPIVVHTVKMYPEFSNHFTTIKTSTDEVVYSHTTGPGWHTTGAPDGQSGFVVKILYDLPGSPFQMFACPQPSKYDVAYDKNMRPVKRETQGVFEWHNYVNNNGGEIAKNRNYAYARGLVQSGKSLKLPSHKAFVYEATEQGDNPGGDSGCPPVCYGATGQQGAWYEDQFIGRHVGKESNVAFYDGHVETMEDWILRAHYSYVRGSKPCDYGSMPEDEIIYGDTITEATDPEDSSNIDSRINIFTIKK